MLLFGKLFFFELQVGTLIQTYVVPTLYYICKFFNGTKNDLLIVIEKKTLKNLTFLISINVSNRVKQFLNFYYNTCEMVINHNKTFGGNL